MIWENQILWDGVLKWGGLMGHFKPDEPHIPPLSAWPKK